MNNEILLIEKRHRYKYDLNLIKSVVKLLVDTDDTRKVWTLIDFKMSISHIKIINYVLRFGDPENIKLLFIRDNNNPKLIKYMLSRIKLKIQKENKKGKQNNKKYVVNLLDL
jgi:phosphoribosylamine-glycine ligase